MDKSKQIIIDELEEKIQRQNQAIAAYREQLIGLQDYKLERDLYSELSNIFALTRDFDDVFKKTLEAISVHLKARYYGIFWVDELTKLFTYRLGKGYNFKPNDMILSARSMMAACLERRVVMWEPHFNDRVDYYSLNQDPAEYNVLCSPIVLMGTGVGVIRLANIDPAFSNKTVLIMQTVSKLLCSSLERLKLQEQNVSTLKSLEASFSIARLLENTLNKQEILKQVCSQVNRLFNCIGCIVAVRDSSRTLRKVVSWPESFVFTGSQASEAIYLKNLIEHFPSGHCVIENIHGEERCWALTDTKIRSLCMAPIKIRDEIAGIIVAIGPSSEPYISTHANLLGILAAQTSMTLERASYFSIQEDLARCDGLSGLLNRRMFQETIQEEYNRVKRYSSLLSLIMLDIDHFKKFNDTYGHQVGDEVIKIVAKTIKSMIRTTDRAFRYGGEEFAILLPETAAENGALLAERIRKQIEANRSVRGLTVTVSLGVGSVNATDTTDSFIKRVDDALYSAKETGRNKVVIK